MASLHGVGESDIIRALEQMPQAKSPTFLITLALACAVAAPLFAAEPPPFGTPDTNSPAFRNQQKIMRTLRLLEKRYGKDAVMLESYALGAAIKSGALLESEARLPGYEERDGKRFLEVRLASGVVFNDNEHSAAQRPMRIFTNIIEPSLRQFQSLNIAAEGVLFRVKYAHKSYKDEFDLRDHLKEAAPEEESVHIYMLIADITPMLSQQISGQELADRATVLVNGTPTKLALEPTPEIHRFQPPSEIK